MPQHPAPPDGGAPSFSRPWALLLVGVGLTLPAWLLNAADATQVLVPCLLALAGAGLIGVALMLQFRQADWRWPERLELAAFVSVAGLGALGCYLAMGHESSGQRIDSGRMFFGAAFLVALAGAALIVLPALLRRVALSLLVLFHFGGLLVAVTQVDPPGQTGPWVSKQAWAYVYRPYLSFLYLTNAYHFYSPEPGPASLFWFAVHYDDKTYTWVKMPDRASSPNLMYYNRILALPQHTFQAGGQPPTLATQQRLPASSPLRLREPWETVYHRRLQGTELLRFRDPQTDRWVPIPVVTDMDLGMQFNEPTEASKKLIASVAQRVLLHHAPPAPSGARAVRIKVYRVVHQIITPYELASGVSPYAKNKHWPYFMGEFDEEGRLKDDRERFLYWYVPIAYVPGSYPEHGLQMAPGVAAIQVSVPSPAGGVLLDCLELHAAGDSKIIDLLGGKP